MSPTATIHRRSAWSGMRQLLCFYFLSKSALQVSPVHLHLCTEDCRQRVGFFEGIWRVDLIQKLLEECCQPRKKVHRGGRGARVERYQQVKACRAYFEAFRATRKRVANQCFRARAHTHHTKKHTQDMDQFSATCTVMCCRFSKTATGVECTMSFHCAFVWGEVSGFSAYFSGGASLDGVLSGEAPRSRPLVPAPLVADGEEGDGRGDAGNDDE